ncbi:MAG: sensor histidine kinase [Planctomycetota bacterium]
MSTASWTLLLCSLLLLFLWVREMRLRLVAGRDAETLTQKREAMRRSLEHLTEGVVLLGAHGEVLYANPAADHLLGAADSHADGGRPRLGEYTSHASLVLMVEGTPNEDTRRQVFELEAGGGGDQHPMLQVTLAPAGPRRRLMVVQDLRADEEVNRKRRDFVANASHELKTPIAALVGLLDLMEEVPEDKRAELLERARRNALGLSNLVDDLLALTRAESAEWQPSPKVLDLQVMVPEVLQSLEDRAADKGLELKIVLPEAPATILADAFAFRTVLHNLALNAVVYTELGEVTITLSKPLDGGTELRVADTGPGIDPEVLPRIFERFFRGDVAHSRASGGTGLGLSLVRNLVQQMGGRVSVQSTPGKGTLFLVELPANPSMPLADAHR